ncbi:hypothetical protein T492DRAFT_16279 [Pavlovales sp. CCMP2436]|nr:hypothetical protein T492DRAFT_16279 [Pavlovales sp. CCMP2436]
MLRRSIASTMLPTPVWAAGLSAPGSGSGSGSLGTLRRAGRLCRTGAHGQNPVGKSAAVGVRRLPALVPLLTHLRIEHADKRVPSIDSYVGSLYGRQPVGAPDKIAVGAPFVAHPIVWDAPDIVAA